MTPEIKDMITLGLAALGSVLGVFNFVRSWRGDRVSMDVTPMAATYLGLTTNGADNYRFCDKHFNVETGALRPSALAVQVLNRSKFPVQLGEIGLLPSRWSSWRKTKFAVVSPRILEGGTLPRWIESRGSVTIVFDTMKLLEGMDVTLVAAAYATTTCGKLERGKSGALREFVRLFKSSQSS